MKVLLLITMLISATVMQASGLQTEKLALVCSCRECGGDHGDRDQRESRDR